MTLRTIAIVGAGNWGTALAILWSSRATEIILWGHNRERLCTMEANRSHDFGGGRTAELPEAIRLTSDLAECGRAELIVFVTPSTALREVATALRPVAKDTAVLLSCTKGLEHQSGMRMSEILQEIFATSRVAVLSGPNLAVEVVRGLPSATVLGCRDPNCAQDLQRSLGSPRFRIYSSQETAGIELGGALKNVFAITAGASDGLGFGDNSKAALVTRCLAEMIRLGTAMGGHSATFYGLSGAGDLIATCFSHYSRNRKVGELLGHGKTVDDIVAEMKTVAEGIPTTRSAFDCARRLQIETPIIDQAYAMLYENRKPEEALRELISRDQKPERIDVLGNVP